MMSKTIVRLRLNQQQLELIDKTIAAGESNSRDDLVRRALREFAVRHLATSDGTKVAGDERKNGS
jgi:Arc/MetJ-type ribon-helix-helix transcriptional regulator